MNTGSTHTNTLCVRHSSGVYNIVIGRNILHHLPDLLPGKLKSAQACIVADMTVAKLYQSTIVCILKDAGINVLPSFVFRPGEKSKSFPSLKRLIHHLVQNCLSRNDFLVALGGGVTGDLAGFAASVYMRGIPVVQIPTTFIAQADSSVGGKTAINVPQGKNLVGSFHAPHLVLCDLETLDTLSDRHVRNGLAEVIKMAVIGDTRCFELLESHAETITNPDKRTLLGEILTACCRLKCQIVENDEKESGIRAWLNLGHTFGHAFECVSGYGNLLHGEAVALGMLAAGRLAVKESICNNRDAERIESLVKRVGLPVRLPELPVENILEAMLRDKKCVSGKLRLILPKKIGSVMIKDNINPAHVIEVLQGLT